MVATEDGRVFVGREGELESLAELDRSVGAKIVVVYGRRRVGKTTLIERAFRKRTLWKFEGLEKKSPAVQRTHFMEQLAGIVGVPSLAKLRYSSWREVFMELAKYTEKRTVTLYFEELQWMASYKDDLVSDLKYVWDNFFSKNGHLILVLCGSAPSFLIEKVMMSKALYNRTQHEFPIAEFSLKEARSFMGQRRSLEEVLDAYLSVGGIPEYLKYLTTESSVYLSLCGQSFRKGGFFVNEAERIFVSSLSKNPVYRRIIEHLAMHGPATRKGIVDQLGITDGGTTSRVFNDLEKCRFVGFGGPLSFGQNSREAKVFLLDSYLQLYYRFIHPELQAINTDAYKKNPSKALSIGSYRQWLGYAFERFCLLNAHQIAGSLGFGAVKYRFGPLFLRSKTIVAGSDEKTIASSGAQIDLAFERADRVITVCEVKYQATPPGKECVQEFERKLAHVLPNYKGSIQRVLISPNGADGTVTNGGYFDRIVTLEELFTV